MAKTSTVLQRTAETMSIPRVLPDVTKKQQLRQIGDDETFSTSVRTLEPGLLECRFAVRPDGSENAKRYEVVSVLDFRTSTPDECHRLAARGAVIDLQRNFRVAYKSNADGALAAAQWSRVDVKSVIVDAARKTADPRAKARTGIAKAIQSGMTVAEVRAMLEEMEKSQ